MKRPFLRSLLPVLSVAAAAVADPPQDATVAMIDEVLRAYADRGRFQGSVLVATDGEIVYRKGFGPANVESGIPNAPGTRHRIAGLGAAFTAAIILQLADEGRLDPDETIAKYLPAYRSDNAGRITLHHLLGHTSGIPGRPKDWALKEYRAEYTLDDLVELANLGGLQFRPGTRYRHCTNGYNLLAAIERFVGSRDLPTENLVNQLGYELMGRGRLNTAIRVFQFNVAAYPQAWNTCDSLAEGYMKAGDHLTAVEYYTRSLQLNPGNRNARTMLRRLSLQPGPF